MKDVQSQVDERNIYLNKVGINEFKKPITLKDKNSEVQHSIATISASVDLKAEERGTHMSRFVEVLNDVHNINPTEIEPILKTMKERLHAETSYLEMTFDYFIEKTAPVSGKKSWLDVKCRYEASLDDEFHFNLTVETPVTTLCPCSKEISEYGAHNQKAEVAITVSFHHMLWIEDIVKIAENNASCEIFPLLKRVDEKYVTETAYENPKFVEDVCRDCAVELEGIDEISYYKVKATSLESIHSHTAFAMAEKKRS